MKSYGFRGALAGALFVAWAAMAQAPDLSRMDLVLKSVPDGPVAKVNGQSIPARDFIEMYTREVELATRRAGGQPPSDADRIQMAFATLGRLIEREVLLQEARKRNLEIPKADLEKAWQQELKVMQSNLSKDGKPLTEAELLAEAGATKEQAMEELKKGLLIEKMAGEIAQSKKATVSDGEIKAFYDANKTKFDRSEQLHLKHILIKAGPTRGTVTDADKAKARQKAQQVLGEIRSGKNFDAVAKAVSQAKETDLGMLPTSQLPPFYVAAAQKLEPNQVSDVIETEYGFHIVQLVEKSAGKQLTFEEVKPLIRRHLLEDKSEQAVKEFVKAATDKPETLQIFLQIDRQLATRPDLKKEVAPKAP